MRPGASAPDQGRLERHGLGVEFATFARHLFLVTGAMFLVVAAVISLRFVQYGVTPVRVVQILSALLGALILISPEVASGRGKVIVAAGCLWSIGLLGIGQYGLAAPALIILTTPVFLAAAVVSTRLAAGLLAWALVGFTGAAGLVLSGQLVPEAGNARFSSFPGNWLAAGVAICFSGIFGIYLVHRLRTHWERANDRLGQRHAQLAELLETAPEGIVLQDAVTGRFTAVNPRAAALFGLEREQLIGKLGFLDVTPARLPDGRPGPELLRQRLQGVKAGEVMTFDWTIRGRGGRDVPCEVSVVRLPEAEGVQLRISITDRSERHRAEELARLSALVFENTSEGMVVVDAKGTILTVNPAMEAAVGYGAARMMGQSAGNLVVKAERDGFLRRLLSTDSADLSWNGEAHMCRADGTDYLGWLSVNTIVDPRGQPLRRVVLCRDVTDLHRAREEILRQANLDFLTGLPNRLNLMRHLDRMMAECQQSGDSLAVLFVDLDRLKQVNDRKGHAAGDAVLCQVAKRLQTCLSPGDIAARHAGDEFTLLLTGPEVELRARLVADQVLAALSEPFSLDREQLRLSASVGIAFYPRDAQDQAGLLTAADLAMYAAKAEGGNGPALFTAQIGQRARERMRLLEDLPGALARGEFVLDYQPIVALRDGAMTMAEALVRWDHPALGRLSPARFLDLAEEARLMGELGELVVKRACEDLPDFAARFGADFRLSINCSPTELDPVGSGTPEPGGARSVAAPSAASGVLDWADHIAARAPAGGGLVVEITERALLEPAPGVTERLHELRAAGVKLALDDFGAGHNSLLYYLDHDFDFLKIDQAFIHSIPANPRAEDLCHSILAFAGRLDGIAIAEGIETQVQADTLERLGCRLGQGYLFSPPLDRDALLALPRHLSPAGRSVS